MNSLAQIGLQPNQIRALEELKKRTISDYDVLDIVVYGSVVRGEADEESDIDVLLITKQQLDRETRHQITDIVCEINLQHDTNLSTLVVDHESWKSGVYSILPIHEEIQSEGISL